MDVETVTSWIEAIRAQLLGLLSLARTILGIIDEAIMSTAVHFPDYLSFVFEWLHAGMAFVIGLIGQ